MNLILKKKNFYLRFFFIFNNQNNKIKKFSIGIIGSCSSIRKQSQDSASQANESSQQLDWKRNVVVVPVQTTPDDLLRTHRKCKDGFYVSHRSYVEKTPEKYTLEPILLKRTGGYNIETSFDSFFVFFFVVSLCFN
jgi:hypothetical protein